jgi:hypothetical protein
VNAGKRLVGTIYEISSAARGANPAIATHKTNADALAYLPTTNAFAKCVDSSDRFMAGNAR